MFKYNNLVQIRNYGKIILKLSYVMDRCGITRNKLSKITGIKYSIIDRYYKAEKIERVDIDLLARMCCALGCNIDELLEYRPDNNQYDGIKTNNNF